MPNNAASSSISTLLAALTQHGWVHHPVENKSSDAVIREIDRIGGFLGARAKGRHGAFEEVVQPQESDDAHPRSLSVRYGLHTLPFHAELSHRPRPCRYLLLGCLNPGSLSTVTMLLNWRNLNFSPEELVFLQGAPILVRTGRYSFYSTVLPLDCSFFRYDPGCVEAVDERGRSALRLVEERLAGSHPDIHEWRQGDILIIDNWRVLHGRGPSERDSGRRLARILIDA